MIQRPLLPVALLYIAGILLGNILPLPLPPLFAVLLGLVFAAVALARFRPALLCLLVAGAGTLNLTRQTAIVSPNDLRLIVDKAQQSVTVRGSLLETPYHRLHDNEDETAVRTLARLKVKELRREQDDWRAATGEIAVTSPGILKPEFFAGQEVEVSGIIEPPPPPVAEGLFDYRAYLRHTGVYFQLRVQSPDDWKLNTIPETMVNPPVSDRFTAWAQKVLKIGLPTEDEPLRLLWAMTLGWKAALSGEVSEPFMKSGTMHIFAISGLHIALIAGILVAVLRVARLPRGGCGIIVIPLIWFYTGVTGWQASAIRSTIMMSVVIAGWSLRRPSELLNSLAAAALAILIWQPQQLFQASFQLSFFVVLSIALFSPVLEKIRLRLLETDPLLPDKLRPRWQIYLHQIAYWCSASLTTSLAAWLGSIPLVAWYFHLFTPVSLLANLIVVPLSSLALAANLASICVSGWLPALAGLFNNSAWFFMLGMIRVSRWCAQVPVGSLWVTPPTGWAIATYYAGLLAIMSGILRKSRWRGWATAGLVLMITVTFVQWQSRRSTARITVLPLNGGGAIFCDALGSANDLLIDCGKPDTAERVTIPFLHAQGINRLERFALTHGDIRNVGATELIQKEFSPREIITSSIPFRSSAYHEILEKLKANPGGQRHVIRGDNIGAWEVLHPVAADRFARADDAALVLATKVAGVRVLLLSDLGRPGQQALQSRIKNADELKADIVVTGLPTETEPLGDGFLSAVSPKVIIVVDSEFPATRRAPSKVRERLERSGIPVFFTQDAGSITITAKDGRWEVSAMDGKRASGRSSHAQ